MSEFPPDSAVVDATFRATLQQADEKAPGAAALISLAAFFAPDAIPTELFRQDAAYYPDDLAPVVVDEARLTALLGVLADQALIEFQPESRTFTMSPAVQAKARAALDLQREAWIGRTIDIIAAAFPEPGPDSAERCERLVAHVQALNAHVPAEVAARNWAWLLGAAGFFLRGRDALADALPLLEASRAIFERLAAANPDKSGTQRNLALSHQRVGDVLEAQGDRRGALAAYQAALAVFERLSMNDPGNAGAQRDFAVAHERVGDMLRAQRNRPAALGAYQAGLAIFERLAAADSGNTEAQHDLAVAQEKVGDMLQVQGQRGDALTAYQACLSLREGLAAAQPGATETLRDLAGNHVKIGDLLAAQGDLPAALAAYQAALAIREALVAGDPANAGWRHNVAMTQGRIGLVFINQGERRSALGAFRKGRENIAQLMHEISDNAALPGDLAWFNGQIALAGFRSFGAKVRLLGVKLLARARQQTK